MGDSMDSYRSRFQHHPIHRSRSPSCLNYFPQNHLIKFLRLRQEGRHDPENKKLTPRQAFNLTPISLQSNTLNNHNRSFSYDDQALSMDIGRLTGLSDHDPSTNKLDLDDVIGRLTSRYSVDSSTHRDFIAHPGLTPDDRPYRSLSVPAPVDRREGSAQPGTPSEAEEVARRLNDYEFPRNQSTDNTPNQSFTLANNEKLDKNYSQRTSHEANPLSGNSEKMDGDPNLDCVYETPPQDGYRITVEMRVSTPDINRTQEQQDIDPVLDGAPNSARFDSIKVNEIEQPDRLAFLQGLDRVPFNAPSSLDIHQPLDDNVINPPLTFTSVRTAQLSNSSPAPSPHHCGISGSSLPTTTVTPIAINPELPRATLSPVSLDDLPPQAYAGKTTPLLPPPLPSSKPRYQISFPRPFRRRLSVTEPSAVPLPPSPPPEFDFGIFENSLELSSCNLLDDSPYVPLFKKPFDVSEPLIDLNFGDVIHTTDVTQIKTDFPTKDSPSRTSCGRFTPLPSPVPSAVDDVMHTSDLAPTKSNFRAKDLSSRTSCGRYTPLSSPVPSEFFVLGSLVSHPSSENVSPRFQSSQDNFERQERNHPEVEASGQVTSPQSFSASVVSEPEPSIAINQQSNSTHRSRSSHVPHPRPPSQVTFVEHKSSIANSVKTPCSCYSAVNQSNPDPRSAKSGVNALTEMALKLHLSNKRWDSESVCIVAQSRAATPPELYFCPPTTNSRSSTSSWTPNEGKVAKLESLIESFALREAQRAEELSRRRYETEKYFTEQDKVFDALSGMIHELKAMRLKYLGDLGGDTIDSQISPGSPQHNAHFGRPNSALKSIHAIQDPIPPSHQNSTYSSKADFLPSLMRGHVGSNSLEASVASNVRAELVNQNPAKVEEPNPIWKEGASKAASLVNGTVKASSRTGKSGNTQYPSNVRGGFPAPSTAPTTRVSSHLKSARTPKNNTDFRLLSMTGCLWGYTLN